MREKRVGTKTASRTKKQTRRKAKKASTPSGTNWARVDATTDEEIAQQIRDDSDDIEWTDQMFAEAKWVMPKKKTPISFRVDPDILEFFRRGGEGYQSRMNAVLRGYMTAKK